MGLAIFIHHILNNFILSIKNNISQLTEILDYMLRFKITINNNMTALLQSPI
jgi:hypothetical protein